MNIDLLTRIADWLERGAPREEAHGFNFDLSVYFYFPPEEAGADAPCYACIAGAAVLFGTSFTPEPLRVGPHKIIGERVSYIDDNRVEDLAASVLGLNSDAADRLFVPSELDDLHGRTREQITPAQAARVLRHLIDTGHVNWHVAFSED